MADGKTRVIGITGIGGLGKSTLAAKIYDEDSTEFEDKVWADISRIGFTELARRVLLKFGVSQETIEAIPEQSLGDALVNHLRQGRYLLVMDNLETLLQSDGGDNKNTSIRDESYRQFFYGWLECGGKSVVLVTTRERLDLPPIRCQWLSLPGLEPVEGATLLQALGIRGTDEELVEFSQKVEGHPLLLTLVAGFLLEEEEFDPQIRYLQRYGLADISHLLTDENLTGLHRGKVDIWMRRVLDESFGRISQRMQQLLLGVCVYRIPFNSAMALVQIHSLSFERDLKVSQPQNKQKRSSLDSSLDSLDSLSPPFEGGLGGSKRGKPNTKSIEQDLRQLVRRSLLQEERDKNEGRWFKFQPLIQEYAKCQTGDLNQAHQRAIDYYCLNTKQPPWEKIEDITEYLEIFYHWCELKQYITAFDILRECDEFLTLRGYSKMQVELHRQLVQNWNLSQSEWQFPMSLKNLGNAYDALGEYKQAIECHQLSLAIYQKIDDRSGIARVLNNLGNTYNSLGEYQRAIEYYQQSLAISIKIADRPTIASSMMGLGSIYNSLGKHQRAIDYHQQCLGIFKEVSDRSGIAGSLHNLGDDYNLLGKYQLAIDYYQQSLVIFKEIRKRSGIAKSLGNLGGVYNSIGKHQQAIDYHQQSLTILKEIGDRSGIANSLGNLGNTYKLLGQYKRAIDYYQQSLKIREDIFDRLGIAKTLQNLGYTYPIIGRTQEGLNALCKGFKILQELELPIDAMPYPQWLKSTIKFAQRGKLHLALCFIAGLIVFPFALLAFTTLILWRIIRAFIKCPRQHP
ncbi:tetratricopeptide repeat protein [Coleofasciculus sp. E2-BRE-01]|uniref:tetratricopeptide repeat protein n=1 Tax=Coleofasciculus sp. E2-BRE-01 TaxID=3069524 RepID=UPI0032F36A35